jgi:hypothetical protein
MVLDPKERAAIGGLVFVEPGQHVPPAEMDIGEVDQHPYCV